MISAVRQPLVCKLVWIWAAATWSSLTTTTTTASGVLAAYDKARGDASEPLVSASSFTSTAVATYHGRVSHEAHLHMHQAKHRSLGSVEAQIGTGNWLEFRSSNTVNSFATPCSTNCSNASSSVALGTNDSPWTFNSNNCTQLSVVDGYGSGLAVYRVLDSGAVVGTTMAGAGNATCQSDPNVCFATAGIGKGTFVLNAGSRSIQLQVVSQPTPLAGGWFQVAVTGCPTNTTNTTNTTRSPTRAPTRAPSRAPTRAPTTNTTNTTRSPTRSPTRAPTRAPTTNTTNTTRSPTRAPTRAPTTNTTNTTRSPTRAPTRAPSTNTTNTTRSPTRAPTRAPSTNTTKSPTKSPTRAPTTNTTKSPTKAPTRKPTNAPVRKPTKAPTPSGTSAPTKRKYKCISPLQCALYIRRDALCGCRRFLNKNKTCVKKKAKGKCCRVNRPKNYVQLVLRKFRRLCRRGFPSLALPG